jgi:hypothetical protein
VGTLYFSLGKATYNATSITSFIYAGFFIFLLLVFGIIIVIAFEIYFKCRNLNYQIKVVREANLYKLELVQRNRGESDSHNVSRRHHTGTFSEKRSKSSSRHGGTPDFNSSPPKDQLRRELLSSGTASKSKFEIEMVSLKTMDDPLKSPLNPLYPPR